MRNHAMLMKACCGYERTPGDSAARPLTSTVPGTVLRAGETRPFLIYARTDANAAIYDRLDDARRDSVTYRVCYCSVFDECWISDPQGNTTLQPRPVRVCAQPPVPYQE